MPRSRNAEQAFAKPAQSSPHVADHPMLRMSRNAAGSAVLGNRYGITVRRRGGLWRDWPTFQLKHSTANQCVIVRNLLFGREKRHSGQRSSVEWL